jgi:hypothetical protein
LLKEVLPWIVQVFGFSFPRLGLARQNTLPDGTTIEPSVAGLTG